MYKSGGSIIGLNNTSTKVCGSGYGRDASISRIEGIDGNLSLKLRCCQRTIADARGIIHFEVREPGLYEVMGFARSELPKTWNLTGYFEINASGDARPVTYNEILRRFNVAHALARVH